MSDPEAEALVDAVVRPPRRRKIPRVAEPLRAFEMQTIPGPQGAIAAWRTLPGSAILLVHGYEDDNALWTPMIDALDKRGFPVVALDLPAHGLSEGSVCLGLEGADAVEAVANALGPIEAVVGHSFGCLASALAVARGLSVKRFVPIASPVRPNGRWRRYAEAMGFSADVAERARALYASRVGDDRARHEPRAALTAVKVPMLFVHSLDDAETAFDGIEEVVAACADARLLPCAGLDHRATAQDPDVIDRIVDFLE